MPQPLSSKDNSLFRQVVKNYESKQYKKGLRASEQVLKKNPNHGDTQAMKALILNSQGQSDEAFSLAKVALKNDMKSHICWHVYGLLYRSVKNYEEAIKAYKFALKIEPDSLQIQRDLALLQVQMRDFQGYIQSRTRMLQARPASRQNWTALAVAHHLSGDLTAAEKVLTMYEDTLKTPPSKADIEHSEAALYKNGIIAETGEIERALEHLESILKSNLDRTMVMELRAQYLLQLDRKEEASRAYRTLLDRNNEYRLYYEGLERSLGWDRTNKESVQSLRHMYDEYAKQSERVDAARRIPLDFLEGDDFKTAAESYLRRMLQKGVPSTFANIKALYKDASKREIIQTIVEDFLSETEVNGASKDADDKASNTFRQSTLYFLAQHYSYHISRDLHKAQKYLDTAIKANPSSVDFKMTRGRILKHYGRISEAADVMDQARCLDERDRYINSKCAKYQLRDNRNEDAIKTMSKFTRNETAGGPLGDLHDMQCMWYITEDGEAYLRQGRLGLALKRFKAIYDIFDAWQEDQFDFHSFSLRKGQIRAYIDMVRWEDRLREHPFYARAAISAIKVYLQLFDDPSSAHASLVNGIAGDLEGMNANERKKALKKARRDQEKQEKAEAERRDAEKKAANKKAGAGVDGEQKKEDPDPQGKLLLETKEPLEDAVRYLAPLLEFSPKNVDAQNIGFEVFIRKRKHILALRCLIAASKVDKANPALHEQTIRFKLSLDALPDHLPPKHSEVISASFDLVPKGTSLSQFNDEFLSDHKNSAPHLLAGLRGRQLLDPKSQASSEKEVLSTLDIDGVTMKDAQDALALLREWKSDHAAKTYLDSAGRKWPDASVFQDR